MNTCVRMFSTKEALLLFVIFVSFKSFSQGDTTQGSLGKVIVTTHRKPAQEFFVPYSTQVVDSDYLSRVIPRTTPEALSGINGVFIQKTNHAGGSPFLRGLTGNQTLILVDGIRLNNSTFRYGPNQYLNTIDAFSISRIEVAKGTGSVQYGSDALGGVLQVFTQQPRFADKQSWSGKVLGKYMSRDMEKTARAEANYSSKHTAFTLGATYRNFGDLVGGDTTGKQSPSGYKELAFNMKAAFLLQKDVQLTVSHQFVQQQDAPVYHKVILENFQLNNFDPQQRMLSYARLNIQNRSRLFNSFELIASWQQTVEQRNSRKNSSSILRQESDKVNTIGFTADINSVFSARWSANSGVEIYRDKVNSSKEDIDVRSTSSIISRGLYPDRSGNGNYSLYSLHHVDFRKWLVEAGIRFNAFSINITDTSLGNINITPSSIVYNASVLYKLSNSQNVYFNFNTGFRAPNIDDMGTLGVVDFRYEVPTYDLAPEKSTNFEVGYKLRTRKLTGTFAAHYMHLENLITRVRVGNEMINGYPVYRKENTEKGYIKGLEGELLYQASRSVSFKGNLAYLYGQSLSKAEPIRRIPPLNGLVNGTYKQDRWFASFEMQYASKQNRLAQGDKDDNRIPKNGTPAWQVFNAYFGYQLYRMKLNAGLQNLLNVDYRTHGSGINGVGRSGWITVAVEL